MVSQEDFYLALTLTRISPLLEFFSWSVQETARWSSSQVWTFASIFNVFHSLFNSLRQTPDMEFQDVLQCYFGTKLLWVHAVL